MGTARRNMLTTCEPCVFPGGHKELGTGCEGLWYGSEEHIESKHSRSGGSRDGSDCRSVVLWVGWWITGRRDLAVLVCLGTGVDWYE